MSEQRRYLFYAHDGYGLGHTRRNLAVAAALAQLDPGAAMLIVTGTDEVHRMGIPPHAGVLKLPGWRKVANENYVARRLNVTQPELWNVRSALLTAAVDSFRPHVVLADKHPFGVNGELRPALELLKKRDGAMALGLRGILDAPATVRAEWTRYDLPAQIAAAFDRVLIYGDARVFDTVREYDFPPALAERTRYCGYVIDHTDRPDHDDSLPATSHPFVLATAGGGEDGFALLEAFLRAADVAAWHGAAVTGPLADDTQQTQLRKLAGRVSCHTFLKNLPARMAAADALVCMGGYNTLIEALQHGTPTVCVPRVAPRTEQLLRARAFERLGLLCVVEPGELTPARLRTTITAALAQPRAELRDRVQATLNLDGARCAAAELLALATTKVTA